MMTRVFKIDAEAIREGAASIIRGELVAYPTDTVYGLGCDPYDEQAVNRLVKAKGRQHGSLPLLVESLESAEVIGRFGTTARDLAAKFWPGPLTIVVGSRIHLPRLVTGPTGEVGLRVPSRSDTLELIRSAGGALVGTSANVSGNPSARSAEEVLRELGGRIDLVLDGGMSDLGRESTVVRIEDDQISVLREKAIGKERILDFAKTKQSVTPRVNRS